MWARKMSIRVQKEEWKKRKKKLIKEETTMSCIVFILFKVWMYSPVSLPKSPLPIFSHNLTKR